MPKPTATAFIDPIGHRATVAREYLLKVTVPLDEANARLKDVRDVAAVATRALAAYAPGGTERDRRELREVTARVRGKGGVMANVVVAVEAAVVTHGTPDRAAVAELRATLVAEGYHVIVRERRECAHGACGADAVIDWGRADLVPPRWFSRDVCGKHDLTTCRKCGSVFLLTSMNAAGQAPSVHCEVCGQILVEWGASKVWTAELVTRGSTPPV